MSRLNKLILIILWLIIISSCGCSRTPQDQNEDSISGFRSPDSNQANENGPVIKTLTIIYTNDEHGWIEGEEKGRGAAEISDLWETEFSDSDWTLILSGGDNWAGPAISTWFKGEATVQVMNKMGYSASVLGNHEFDFGLETLTDRIDQADFPYLGANIRYKVDGTIPTEIGIKPFTIIEFDEMKIGLIGLANVDTPSITHPDITGDFNFLGYAETLRKVVPQVRSQGVDMIFVPSHLCSWELAPLARDVNDLGIMYFGGGHCHEEYANIISGSIILSGGSNFRSYGYATIDIDMSDLSIVDARYDIVKNIGGSPKRGVAEIISEWKVKTEGELDVPIGYAESDIGHKSVEMAALITESWLLSYPADVALTNWGGMRDRIPAGEITISDIISVMPFDNFLVDVELSGEQLLQVLAFGNQIPPVGGIHIEQGNWAFDIDGKPIDPFEKYSLLVTDYLYAGGDDYLMLANYDPEAYKTGISWRQPVIDWMFAQKSNHDKPIDLLIENKLLK